MPLVWVEASTQMPVTCTVGVKAHNDGQDAAVKALFLGLDGNAAVRSLYTPVTLAVV